MTYLNRLLRRSSAPAPLLVVLCLLALDARAGDARCPDSPALQSLLDAQDGFARAARDSLRDAFLGVLADDAWVLEPTPTSTRAFFATRPERPGPFAGYPQVAVVAPSGDLGFTSGPYEDVQGPTPSFGHFLTVWRRGEDCRWRVVVDGGVTHPPRSAAAVAAVAPPSAAGGMPPGPPGDLAAAFESVSAREGLGAALRTYARNDGFLLLVEGQPPLDLGQAEPRMRKRVLKRRWRESAHGVSADTTLSYVVGELGPGAFTQIWQYDPHTANWGLRVLLLTQR